MLLTSSQVSVAISSAIVVAFTAALFLSGYVIQQRTVRHLRAAIRPDSSPQIYLPDRFRDDTTELADGTIVMLDEYGRPVRQEEEQQEQEQQRPAQEKPGEKPISRAERRRLIKEEIQRLSQGEEPLYYQRRLW
ncbi:hypothetical protein M406DRAFT_251469 [Cryphonectria parasitica EP155]|uniref:Uncharacterized protein n=1 Tax=Cryphonectria parasitica (strain ATCC 38755 / EP155) TaxID=660469 RepID=A0A9P4Y8I0_CRYP1|nr:uncharacterized protein M406DRAFT_251469 [Cryphonectria parasitica EP155]KAF3768691.1 hypothetical protein M406DRAFT_251469 [Cryphonectria parasitica EP155]